MILADVQESSIKVNCTEENLFGINYSNQKNFVNYVGKKKKKLQQCEIKIRLTNTFIRHHSFAMTILRSSQSRERIDG